MLRMMGLFITLLTINSQVLALSEARLLNQSSSGQTVVFNLGSFDGIKQGDYGIIIKQIRSLESRDLRLVPVARARNIKINTDSSVWILYRVFDHELLINGDKFQVLTESHLLRGRRDVVVGRSSLVVDKLKAKEQVGDALKDDVDRLSKRKEDYETFSIAHEQQKKSDTDAELVDLEAWEKNRHSNYRTSIYKGPNKTEWTRQLRLATFEKLVVAYLEQVNNPNFNYDSFYQKQMKSSFSNEFLAKSNHETEYGDFLKRESFKSIADAKLYRTMLEKGESWSEDFSDEQLKSILGQVSILQERDRRIVVMAKPTRYAMSLEYGTFMTDAQTDKDSQYRRDKRYSTEVDFEATPLLKHPTLESITLNGTFRLNQTAFAANSVNADLDEKSFSLGANWYPYYAPYSIEVPVLFVGAYMRSGMARAKFPSTNETANYTVYSLPGLRAGFKFLMRNNFGLRLLVSLETLKLERYESSKVISSLPSTTNVAEAKIGFGLVYAF